MEILPSSNTWINEKTCGWYANVACEFPFLPAFMPVTFGYPTL
jgi:hypothetical protein